MKVQINDCTVRDGGYLLKKNPSHEYVDAVFEGLLVGGVDIIEIGFLQKADDGESVVYRDSLEAGRHVPEVGSPSRFTGFCDNSRYSLDLLDECGNGAFEYLKISFAKHEAVDALRFVEGAKAKGYKVLANPMDAPSYSKDERSAMIEEINRIKPYCFSIVDTFGTMYLSDLEAIFAQMDHELDSDIRVGLHSHNNLQLSNALAERMIDLAAAADRDIIVDASLYGMGRGAGNASTEVLASYLNVRYGGSYDLDALFAVIDERIAPLKRKVEWGYDLPMFACGTLGAHVDNVFHINALGGCSSKETYRILSVLKPDQRKRYGSGYSKTDFSALDDAIREEVGGGRFELR